MKTFKIIAITTIISGGLFIGATVMGAFNTATGTIMVPDASPTVEVVNVQPLPTQTQTVTAVSVSTTKITPAKAYLTQEQRLQALEARVSALEARVK